MCPACISTMAWMVAGATSAGGVAAIVVNKLRAKKSASNIKQEHDHVLEKRERIVRIKGETHHEK